MSVAAMTPATSVTIERSRDYSLLWRIATSPEIYRVTSDDCSPIPSRWRVAEREDCIYLLATELNHLAKYVGGGNSDGSSFQLEPQLLGFAAFYPVNGVTFESHVCFLSRGPVNELCYREMLQWMWEHTKVERIIGAIPEYNFLAIAFARRCGFEKFGWNRDSWLKNGKLYAQALMGISRPLESRP